MRKVGEEIENGKGNIGVEDFMCLLNISIRQVYYGEEWLGKRNGCRVVGLVAYMLMMIIFSIFIPIINNKIDMTCFCFSSFLCSTKAAVFVAYSGSIHSSLSIVKIVLKKVGIPGYIYYL